MRTHRRLVRHTQAALEEAQRLIPVTIAWVPGHSGIALNELSDGLAKRGAHGITSTVPLQRLPAPPISTSLQGSSTRPSCQRPRRQERKQPGNNVQAPRMRLRPRKKQGESVYVPSKRPNQSLQGIDFSLYAQPGKKKRKHSPAQLPPSPNRRDARQGTTKRRLPPKGRASTKRKKTATSPKIRGLSRFNVSRRKPAPAKAIPRNVTSFPDGPDNAPT